MKKIGMLFTALLTSAISLLNVNAINSLDNLNDTFVQKNNNTIGYVLNDQFVCYSCGAFCLQATTSNYTCLAGAESDEQYGRTGIASGIGVYYKNGDSWATGSFPGAASQPGFGSTRYPLSSLFVAAASGDEPTITTSTGANGVISDYLLESNGTSLTKTVNGATITVTPEVFNDKKFIKLNYYIKNGATEQTINVATFNDIYIGGEPTSVCDDNAAYELNTHISNITNGFNAKTGSNDSQKYMTVVLEENTGLLSNGGGKFSYWAGNHNTVTTKEALTNVISNLFKSGNTGIPAEATSYADSEFSYSWSKKMAADEETTFSTLIGLGNLSPVTIDIDEDTVSPNYDKDNHQFTLTENDSNVKIGGTIKDECGMGTCTYKINDSESIPCDQEVYYTSGDSFTSDFSTTIDVKYLKKGDNKFVVTANSVACGTATDELTFNLPNDIAKNPQTGINNNYIILGIILVGGIGVFIYSRKHNKFPQV